MRKLCNARPESHVTLLKKNCTPPRVTFAHPTNYLQPGYIVASRLMYKSVFQLSRVQIVQTVQTRSDTFRRVQTGLNAVQTRSDWSERPPLFAVQREAASDREFRGTLI